MEITYSLNQYDENGDKYNDCLILNLDDNFLLKLKDIDELDKVINQLKDIRKEISEELSSKGDWFMK